MKKINLLLILLITGCGRKATFSVVDVPPPCTVVSTTEGTTIVCGNTSTFIPNGKDGANGQDGTNGTDGQDGADGQDGQDAVLEVIAPCNDSYNEVLIRIADRTLIGHYSGGTVNRQALVVLTPGSYVTTGRGTTCHFVVGPAPEYQVTW